MHLGDTQLDVMSIDHLEDEFLVELERLIAMHRYVTVTAHRDLYGRYDEIVAEHSSDPDFDGQDVGYQVEREFGFDPWEVEGYVGSATIVRAVALVEIVLARFAATCWTRPELVVFPHGKVWVRLWAVLFYKQCLLRPFNVDGGGFGALQKLRDVITHGYGVPVTEQDQQKVARDLYQSYEHGTLLDAERELGYRGVASFFGDHAVYDKSAGLTGGLLRGVPPVSPTPLATYRALGMLRSHVEAAAEAVRGGMRDVTGTKFEKTVVAYWEKKERQLTQKRASRS